MKFLIRSLDLIRPDRLTLTMTTRRSRHDRASNTQDTILEAAERLYAEHGVLRMFDPPGTTKQQGRGSNATVGIASPQTDLVARDGAEARASMEQFLARMVGASVASAELPDSITCVAFSLTGASPRPDAPTTYAHFRRAGIRRAP